MCVCHGILQGWLFRRFLQRIAFPKEKKEISHARRQQGKPHERFPLRGGPFVPWRPFILEGPKPFHISTPPAYRPLIPAISLWLYLEPFSQNRLLISSLETQRQLLIRTNEKLSLQALLSRKYNLIFTNNQP